MSEITKNDIKKIARLAHIEISEADCEIFTAEIGNIVKWIEQLDEVETSNTEPLNNTNHSTLTLYPDLVNDGNIANDILRNAKNAKYNYFTVPKVIE